MLFFTVCLTTITPRTVHKSPNAVGFEAEPRYSDDVIITGSVISTIIYKVLDMNRRKAKNSTAGNVFVNCFGFIAFLYGSIELCLLLLLFLFVLILCGKTHYPGHALLLLDFLRTYLGFVYTWPEKILHSYSKPY